MALSKKKLLTVTFLWVCVNSAFSFSFQANDDSNLLLKNAHDAGEAAIGIRLAKQACQHARRAGNKPVIVKSLSLIADYYWDLRSYDSSKNYAQNALLAANKYKLDSLKGNCWLSLGLVSYSRADFKQSIVEYNKAASEYIKAHQTRYLAMAYMDIGVSNRKLSQYTEAINNFMGAAAIFENSGNKKNLSSTYSSVAGCFSDLNNYSKALEYNNKALQIRQEIDDRQLISSSLNNIGFVFLRAKRTDSAIFYLDKSLAMMKNVRDSSELVLTLQNLGASWRMKGHLDKAESNIVRSLQNAATYQMNEEFARSKQDLAEIYLPQKKYQLALEAINATIDYAKKANVLDLLQRAYAVKYNIYKQTGDYKNAVLYADKKEELKDTIFNLATNRIIAEKEAKYQAKQKERDIAQLRERGNLQQTILSQQTKYIIVLSIAAVLLAVLFVIAYNNFRKKNKANQRIQILMKDLHHRVKNNLQILSGLFSMQIDNQSDENTRNALRENEARLTSMNLIHNKLYLDNTTTKIEMNDYLTKLLNHIKDSFGGIKQSEINLRIEVSNIMLEADKAVAIGLIANELATNSFKYAFNGQGSGEIHLALQLVEKSKILLTLADNGVGLKPENKDKAPSFGLKLVNLMARQLNSTLVVKSNPGVFYQMEISI